MELRAGVVFAGEVVEIRRAATGATAAERAATANGRGSEDAAAEDGVVEVVFRVDDAVRGCSAGGYAMRESAGLWSNTPFRYRIGQRALWFLYAPNSGGLSSPVDGMLGVLPMAGRGWATRVDLRWVRASLLRKDRAALGIAVGATSALAADGPPREGPDAQPDGAQGAEAAIEQPTASYNTVAAALRGLEAKRNAAN